MAEFQAIVAPLLQRLPGTEEQKLAIVFGGAAFSVATLCCACGSRTTAAVPAAAPATAAVSAEVGAVKPSTVTATAPEPATAEEKTPAKERKRPAPVETGTPVASSSASGEAVAEMLGRRQQVLDEIVAVDAECVRQLQALDKHFVGEHASTPLAHTTACWPCSLCPLNWLAFRPGVRRLQLHGAPRDLRLEHA